MLTREDGLRFQHDFLKKCSHSLQLAALFEQLDDVAFFVKDEKSRFVRANRRCLETMNCQEEWQVLGRTDLDLRSNEIGSVYLKQDEQVIKTGKPVIRCLQMVPHIGGSVQWYFLTKIPITDRNGKICGIAGAMFSTHQVGGLFPHLQRMEPALRHIYQHYGEPITTRRLADLTHLSERQFVRIFRATVGESPMRHLLQQRIRQACHKLVSTHSTIGNIALECGFCDQSALTRSFQSQTGLTPSAYRLRALSECGDVLSASQSRDESRPRFANGTEKHQTSTPPAAGKRQRTTKWQD